MIEDAFDITHAVYSEETAIRGLQGGQQLIINAGPRGRENWAGVDSDGEENAYERKLWARHVTIYVSPTGRSVRVFVDGDEVHKGAPPTTATRKQELIQDALIHLIDTADEMAKGDESVTRAGHVRHAAENGRRALLGADPL